MASLQSNINNLQSILTTINNLPEQNNNKDGYRLTLKFCSGLDINLTVNGKQIEYYDSSYNSDYYTIVLTNISKADIVSDIKKYESISISLSEDTVLDMGFPTDGSFIAITVESGNSYNVLTFGGVLISDIQSTVIQSGGDGFTSIELDPYGNTAQIIYGSDRSPQEEWIYFAEGETWGSYLFGQNNTLPFTGLTPHGGFFVDQTGKITYYGASTAYLILTETGIPVNIFDPIYSTSYEAVYSTADFEGQ